MTQIIKGSLTDELILGNDSFNLDQFTEGAIDSTMDHFLNAFKGLKDHKINEELGVDEMDNVLEVHMSEAAKTIKNDKNSILATYGAGPCIIVGGYSKGRSMLAHFTGSNRIGTQNGDYFKEVAEQNKMTLNQLLFFIGENNNEDFKIIVSGGGHNDKQKEEILHHITTIIGYNMKNTHEILISNSSSLAINNNTGKFYKYDCLKNPNKKEINQLSTMSPQINTIYNEHSD